MKRCCRKKVYKTKKVIRQGALRTIGVSEMSSLCKHGATVQGSPDFLNKE